MTRRMRRLLSAFFLLGGCTTADITLPDGTTVHFSRMWTDAAIQLTADGDFVYSSNASDVAQQQAINSLLKALGLVRAGAGGVGYSPLTQPLPPMLRMNEVGL
jgi:hypothetical protein